MTTIIEIVRRHVGRRHKITHQEMVDILLSIDMNLVENSTITGRTTGGALYVGRQVVDDPSRERDAVARAWVRMCRGITCISVIDHGPEYGFGVRYDDPGSMHPLSHAALMFVPEALAGYEYDQVGQMRRKADRVLVVRDEPSVVEEPESAEPSPPSWVTRLRRHPRIDGKWARIHDDGMLELRDPNDGQSSDPADKCRHQYRVTSQGDVEKRRLPPESVGDQWAHIGPDDPGPHEWELLQMPPVDDLLYAWWEQQVL